MIKLQLMKCIKTARIVFIVLCVYIGISAVFLHSFSNNKSKADPLALKRDNRVKVYQIINDKELNKTREGRVIASVFKFSICATTGEGCTKNPADGDVHAKNSLTGILSKLIILPLSHPPSSSIAWAIDGLGTAGFIPKSYAAQGLGFAGLSPFSQIWILFRNLAYMILVVVVITIGFLIMFRRKVNAQTVVSLENSLPRIVIAFLLITFSFPLAGLLIDLMYLLTFVIISFLAANTISPYDAIGIKSQVLNGGFSLWDEVFAVGNYWKVGDALLSIMPSGVNVMLRIILGIGSFFVLSATPVIGMVLEGTIIKGVATINGLPQFMVHLISALLLLPVLFFLAPVIFSIIFFLTGLFVFFRIFFLLFKNYIQIILLIIFAPVILMLEAIPGQKMFTKWLKLLVANLLAFPVTIGIILLSNIIVAIPSSVGNGGKLVPLWTPPLLYSSFTIPDAFSVLVGVGILFMIPNILKSLKQWMGLKDGLLSGVGAGMFFGGIGAAAGGGMGGLNKYASIRYAVGGFIDPTKAGIIGKLLGTKGGGGGEHPPKVG